MRDEQRRKPMRIAMMVRGYIASPGPSNIIYAPIDLAIEIAEGLVAKGHEVDFYGPSGTKIKSVNIRTRNLRALIHSGEDFDKMLEDKDLLAHYVPSMWDQYLTTEMFKRARRGEYDLLYFQHPETALTTAQLFPKVPVAYTLHDPILELYQEIFEMFKSQNQFFISISDNQRSRAPDLQYAGTVYNGIDTGKFSFSKKQGEYLLSVGRIVPEKGVDVAIRVAQKTGERLIIGGPIYSDKREYFNQKIRPHLNDKIKYVGLIDHNELPKYMRGAKAFLMPISWDEPFGLTMAEAMSCGTPVIAFRRGSVPEIVQHGRTGFIVDNESEMIEALGKVDKIDRQDCRNLVVEKFSTETMVNNYEIAFKNILRVTRRNNFPSSVIKRQYFKSRQVVKKIIH